MFWGEWLLKNVRCMVRVGGAKIRSKRGILRTLLGCSSLKAG